MYPSSIGWPCSWTVDRGLLTWGSLERDGHELNISYKVGSNWTHSTSHAAVNLQCRVYHILIFLVLIVRMLINSSLHYWLKKIRNEYLETIFEKKVLIYASLATYVSCRLGMKGWNKSSSVLGSSFLTNVLRNVFYWTCRFSRILTQASFNQVKIWTARSILKKIRSGTLVREKNFKFAFVVLFNVNDWRFGFKNGKTLFWNCSYFCF